MRRIALILFFSLWSSVCYTQALVSDSSTKLWLSRLVVNESGWRSSNDQFAISYVLYRIWKKVHKRRPSYTYLNVMHEYSRGLFTKRGRRYRWIRGLNYAGDRPVFWPRRLSWSRHRLLWLAVMDRTDRWALGSVRDPCRGKADHWGAPGYRQAQLEDLGWRRVRCGRTANWFWKTR